MHFNTCKQQQEQCINKLLDDERFTNYTGLYMRMWNLSQATEIICLQRASTDRKRV